MDAIQLVLDVHKRRIIRDHKHFIFKQYELSEATYLLLASYLKWLRKTNANPHKADVSQQNEEKNREFKFLCKHNLLFFLTVTGQFKTIEKLFKTPSFSMKLRHLISSIKKERYKRRKKKRKLLKIRSAIKMHIPKIKSMKKSAHQIDQFNEPVLTPNRELQDNKPGIYHRLLNRQLTFFSKPPQQKPEALPKRKPNFLLGPHHPNFATCRQNPA
ncbi:MAG: hypothetical protein ACRCXC_05900 [Legionella sp.]